MNKLLRAIRLIKKNRTDFFIALLNNFYFLFSDKMYLQLMFRCRVGYKLNLKDPKTFNEKLQWLKLYNRNPLYTTLVDKYAAKDYVAQKIGKKYIVPTLGVWNNANEINFDILPNQFVLKTTNGGGGCDVVICKDKSKLNKMSVIKQLNQSLKKNIYKTFREWPYKNVPPRIIAEKYLEDENGVLNDFKVLCFNGVPKITEYHQGRFSSHTQDFYDENWALMPITQGTPMSGIKIERPILFDEMKSLSTELSKDIPHVRVDWYIIHNQLYFGEMTFYDASGFDDFEPKEYNRIFGDWIKLPQI